LRSEIYEICRLILDIGHEILMHGVLKTSFNEKRKSTLSMINLVINDTELNSEVEL